MDAVNRLLVTYLFNAAWQLVLVAAIASLCSQLLRRAASKYRHLLWVAALILGALVPLWSLHTIRLQNFSSPETSTSTALPVMTSRPVFTNAAPASSATPGLWSRLPRHGPTVSLSPALVWAFVVCYAMFFLYRLGRLLLAWRRTTLLVHRLSDGVVSHALLAMTKRYAAMFQLKRALTLCSTETVGPLTLGVRHPLLLIPRTFSETASEPDLAAAICHELAHVRRRDFLWNLIYEFLYLPISFHPAAMLVKARIDQTRELACDEMAAERLAARADYARSLVGIAHSLCAERAAAASGYALGLFDATTLEDRIKNLLNKGRQISSSLGRALTLSASVLLAVLCFAASSYSLQIIQAGDSSGDARQFLGTWQATFKGEPFFTINLRQENGTLTGTCVATSSVTWDNDGELNWVDENKVQTALSNVQVKGNAAILTLDDAKGQTDQFELRLVSDNQAEGKFVIPPGESNVPKQKPWTFNRLPAPAAEEPARLGLIVFTGRTISIDNSELDAFKKRLQEEINAKGSGNVVMRDITSEIVAFWQMHGFYRFRVNNMTSATVNSSENLFSLIVEVEEGPQYRVNALQWEGATVFSPAELQAMLRIQPGDILNPSKVREGEQAIRAAYAARGYSQITFTTQRLADDDNHTITWIFKINEKGASKSHMS